MRDSDRVEALGEVAWDVLQRMVRELLSRKPGGYLVDSDLERLDLKLPLILKGIRATPERFSRELVESIDRQLDDAVQHAAAFRPGFCYCHRCACSDCEHSVPPSCRHIFIGYGSTGLPRWEDFAQYCLDSKLPQVDRLYANPPAFLTVVHGRKELRGSMLGAFRNESFELLGQVVSGFFPIRVQAAEGRGVLALTLQAVASRLRDGGIRPGLNLIGRAPGGELSLLWQRHDELPWRRAVLWAQSALATIPQRSTRVRRGRIPAELEQRVEGILRGLARRLEQDSRSRSRRTVHAQERHASGSRPTGKALDDARSADLESCMIDESSQTWVVLGDRGRTHFFAGNGRLVSSVRYSRDAIERKIKADRWRPASEEEVRALRQALGVSGEVSEASG